MESVAVCLVPSSAPSRWLFPFFGLNIDALLLWTRTYRVSPIRILRTCNFRRRFSSTSHRTFRFRWTRSCDASSSSSPLFVPIFVISVVDSLLFRFFAHSSSLHRHPSCSILVSFHPSIPSMHLSLSLRTAPPLVSLVISRVAIVLSQP
ncbi:hypothetical protein HGRIS_005683 [Hohenbuehelia grisea]|uniref:Uncharacterized protein n=1 Tax=Hohenbuehelia grisea TaxID=104357 RepID=A0ABR3JZN2_9AGAR